MDVGRLGVRLLCDPPGVIESPARPDPHVVIHVGPSVEIRCERGDKAHTGVSVHGDVDIIPAGMRSRWILKQRDCALVVRVSRDLIQEAAEELAVDPARAVLLNRFQIRDMKLEHLGWALKTEMEHGFRNGRLYSDSIGAAMACQLLQGHSLVFGKPAAAKSEAMPGYRLRRVLGYIEDSLSGDLSLSAIANISGLSVSQCQRAFRTAMGLSVHQYVIRRRVDRAAPLLANRHLSVGEVAVKVGFSHQSHLAYHMRRLLGAAPASMRQSGR